MTEFIDHFHFIRPYWLLGVPCALVVYLLVRHIAAPLSDWHRVMDKPLAQALIQSRAGMSAILSVSVFAVVLTLSFIALAGPSWQKEVPNAFDQQANVAVILANSDSMYASDIVPTRNQRVKDKIGQLLERHPKGRFGLIAYADTAHTVVPLTDDPQVFHLFLDALEPKLMPQVESVGSALNAALQQALTMLGNQQTDNIVLVTDTVSEQDLDVIHTFIENHSVPLQILAVGTEQGGELKRPDDRGYSVKAVDTRLDVAQFLRLKQQGNKVIGITSDQQDVTWLSRNIVQATQNAHATDERFQWRDEGYKLIWLILPFALLWFRKQAPLLMLALTLNGGLVFSPSSEAAFIDWWLTPDQQAQLAFDQKDYQTAATLYTDDYRKGRAYYLAGNYQQASTIFSQRSDPESMFYLANSYAQQKQWELALSCYEAVLQQKADFTEAETNRHQVAAIVEKLNRERENRKSQQSDKTMLGADKIVFDERGKGGVDVRIDGQPNGETTPQLDNWLNGLDVSPAQLMQNQFTIQLQQQNQVNNLSMSEANE